MGKEIDKGIRFDPNEMFISYTDLKGNITYVNDVFVRLSGYAKEDLLTDLTHKTILMYNTK